MPWALHELDHVILSHTKNSLQGRSAQVEPVSDKYTCDALCERSARFGASGCNVAEPWQTREVWRVKARRFYTVELFVDHR
jgi:hypothetical protein